MYDKKSLVLGFALLIVGILCLIQVNKEPAIDPDAKISIEFISKGYTFIYNGVPNSIKVVNITHTTQFMGPYFKIVELEFDCFNIPDLSLPYYVHHTAILHVSDGKVTKCIIDGEWDEVLPAISYQKIALDFLYKCPTFKFDGIRQTVRVQEVVTLKTMDAYRVYISFDCANPSYGDRTGQTFHGYSGLTQQHLIKINVLEGKVTNATIDGVWDEVNQKTIQNDIPEGPYTLILEDVRDIAVWYAINSYLVNTVYPKTLVYTDLTPKDSGIGVAEYSGEGWKVTLRYPFVMMPTYSVEVEYVYKGGAGSGWVGTIDGSGKVEVTSLVTIMT